MAAALDKEMEANMTQSMAPDTTREEQVPSSESTERETHPIYSVTAAVKMTAAVTMKHPTV